MMRAEDFIQLGYIVLTSEAGQIAALVDLENERNTHFETEYSGTIEIAKPCPGAVVTVNRFLELTGLNRDDLDDLFEGPAAILVQDEAGLGPRSFHAAVLRYLSRGIRFGLTVHCRVTGASRFIAGRSYDTPSDGGHVVVFTTEEHANAWSTLAFSNAVLKPSLAATA